MAGISPAMTNAKVRGCLTCESELMRPPPKGGQSGALRPATPLPNFRPSFHTRAGVMDLLKLIALDRDDLEVVSAHLQDAVVKVGEVLWRPAENRVVVGL